MPDLADRAADSIELMQGLDERRARGHSAPESHPHFDGIHCVEPDCLEEIPVARLRMGKVRCVDCQRLKEMGKL